MAVTNGKRKIRYAVVGLGWIAQETVLPAFCGTRLDCPGNCTPCFCPN